MDPINWKEILQIFLNLPLPVMLIVSGIGMFALGAGLKIPLGGDKRLAITGKESRKWGAMVGGMMFVFSGITLSVVVEDPSTSQPTPAPTVMVTPTLNESLPAIEDDPQLAIIDYYAALNSGQFQTAWDSLSFDFQHRINHDDYDAYVDYWDSAPTVVVVNLETSSSYGPEATLAVGLYYANIQKILNFEFDLIYDFARELWLIDGVARTD